MPYVLRPPRLEQLFDILGWSAQHGPIATHNDRPLDQIRMFRHEGDQFFIREVLFSDAQLFGRWFVLTEDFAGGQRQLFQQSPEVRGSERDFIVINGFKFRPTLLQKTQGRPALGARWLLVDRQFLLHELVLLFGINSSMSSTKAKNTICLWFNKDAQDAARFYAATFPDSKVTAIHKAPGDFPSGKEGEILTVEFTVFGVPCLGLNGGPQFKHSEAFSFQIATDTQEETDRYWNAIVSNGGEESACGWCRDRWGISWQITPRALTDAMAAGGAEAKRAFNAMMEMGKIDIAQIEVVRRG
jgi:predicted 3-demethylubiquinone-9 3-methyltransferase (glyoxalase superfamily)